MPLSKSNIIINADLDGATNQVTNQDSDQDSDQDNRMKLIIEFCAVERKRDEKQQNNFRSKY